TGPTWPGASPQPGCAGDRGPVFADDGNAIAVARRDIADQDDVYIVTLATGNEQRLTTDQVAVYGADWRPDGRVVFSASPNGRASLWQASPTDRRIEQIPTSSTISVRPSVASQTGALVYQEVHLKSEIHEIDLSVDIDADQRIRPLIQSTRQDFAGRISPDGTRLAFLSDRSGSLEIWIADRDGGNTRQLSTFEDLIVLAPHWSPDATEIAVSVQTGELFSIRILDVASGTARRLTSSAENEIVRFWSRAGPWIVYQTQIEGQSV
ncbi:MAG: hypothetical protein GY728_06815, partial [Phycisphaeraceae bacterium]|nr:hypothetical protein [Phycisphaeraceae bacterium]